MVLQITYQIRFPVGGNFNSDPKYLFIKALYQSIKKVICMNKENKCIDCPFQSKCLYYFLSGENFTNYPAILVDRMSLEKKQIDKNESINLTFYLIGVASQYIGFIREYFDITSELVGVFFQKHLIKQEFIDDVETYNGIITYNGLIPNLEEITKAINYYNDKYNCNYPFPKIEMISQGAYIRDFNQYQINSRHFNLNGYKMVVKVEKYPQIFMQIGIGKNAILGGGKSHAN